MSAKREQSLKAFFSIDIVGSTEYKSKRVHINKYEEHWLRFFEGFFVEFPVKFQKKIQEQCDQLGRHLGPLARQRANGERVSLGYGPSLPSVVGRG